MPTQVSCLPKPKTEKGGKIDLKWEVMFILPPVFFSKNMGGKINLTSYGRKDRSYLLYFSKIKYRIRVRKDILYGGKIDLTS